MKMRLLGTLAVSVVGSMLPRVLVVLALVTSNTNAASLQPSETRQQWQDLQVITLDSQGYRAKTVYTATLSCSHCQRCRENRPRSEHQHTGNLHWDLYQRSIRGANRLDTYKQYYD